MKAFEIHDQVRLPFSKCAELVLSGLRFRLFRAAITVSIVALAVAFLMTILGDSLIGRNVVDSVVKQTEPRRQFVFWVDRLTSGMTDNELSGVLIRSKDAGERWNEMREWGGFSESEMEELSEVAVREKTYLYFFRNLSEGQLRPLVGRVRGRAIFRLLSSKDKFEAFVESTREAGVNFPGSREEFKEFLMDWNSTHELRVAIIEGHDKSVEELRNEIVERSIPAFLASLDDNKVTLLRKHGFHLEPDSVELLREQAQLTLDADKIRRALNNSSFKERLGKRYRIKDLNEVTSDDLFGYLQSVKEARWFAGAVEDAGMQLDIEGSRVLEVAGRMLKRSRVAEIEEGIEASSAEGTTLGFTNRVLWLIIVSMIVCVVGIANAMLMSVTERFTEIATMKCLGATDGFIMLNFLMESGLQGFFGGIFGAIIGLVLGIMRSSLGYGLMVFQNMPGLAILSGVGISIGAGVFISIVAAIYPAYVAARLAPLEAMRVE